MGELEEFRDVRVDLAELIIKVGEGLADRARCRRTPRRWPRPSQPFRCTPRPPASRRRRS